VTGRMSPHMRNYGVNISGGRRLTSMPPDAVALRLIAEVEEYVKWDDGAKGTPLCWIIHEPGVVCRKLEGHE